MSVPTFNTTWSGTSLAVMCAKQLSHDTSTLPASRDPYVFPTVNGIVCPLIGSLDCLQPHKGMMLSTYDFSSCFFPKFKKSAKGRFSREMTYFFGFYGPKIGGGGSSYPAFVQKYQKP